MAMGEKMVASADVDIERRVSVTFEDDGVTCPEDQARDAIESELDGFDPLNDTLQFHDLTVKPQEVNNGEQ